MGAVQPSRRRPPTSLAVAGWLAVVAVGVGAWVLASGPEPATAGEHVDGQELYARTCLACHGPEGAGREGEGIEAGPPVTGLDVAFVDQLVRTGRMPIRAVELGVERDLLSDDERQALIDWMIDRFDLEGEIPDVPEGDRARGHELYGLHCSACHGATGQGGIGAEGSVIPDVIDLDRVAVVEAIRVGPFDMPRFTEETISDEDAAAIGTFVEQDLSDPPETVARVSEMHRVTFWLFSILVSAVLVWLVQLVARPVRGQRRPLRVEQ